MTEVEALRDAQPADGHVERRLREVERTLVETERLTATGSWSWEFAPNVVSWSDELYRLFGVPRQAFEVTFERYLDRVHRDDQQGVLQALGAVLDGSAEDFEIDYRVVHSDGQMRWQRGRGRIVRDEQGLAVRLFGTAQDITVHREAEQQLRKQRDELAVLAGVMQATDDAVMVTSPDGTILRWNPGAERLYGYTCEQAVGQHISLILPAEVMAQMPDLFAELAVRGHAYRENVAVRKNGDELHTSVTISEIGPVGGPATALVAIARDVTEQKRSQERERGQAAQLTWLASHDPLTGLGNRALFHQRLTDMIDRATQNAQPALIVLDLDDFKTVNDSLGHAVGDALLVAAAERLQETVGDEATVTRLGGDEFGILLETADEAGAVDLAERVLESFYLDFFVLGHSLRAAASIGITLAGQRSTPSDVLRSADLAMYAAKFAGKGKLAIYGQEMLAAAQQRLDLENHLRHALQRDEMHLAYQPLFDARTGDLRGVEALLRWDHPTWGAVSPATFIPVAEMCGMIVPLGEWVLRRACRDARELADKHRAPVAMSVNVSIRQLQDLGFVAVVRSALLDAGLSPALLTLELTESVLMNEGHSSMPVLHELHALGVHLSIDHFGTGHSSLARLRSLPVSELKIDRLLVNEITRHGDCAPIITAIVAMARALGLFIVAQGVETQVQLDALRRLGCDAIQGYFVARPVVLADLKLDAAPMAPLGERQLKLAAPLTSTPLA